MTASRHLRTAEQEELIKKEMEKPLARLKADLLDICQIDEEMGAAAIMTALRTSVPGVLQYWGIE